MPRAGDGSVAVSGTHPGSTNPGVFLWVLNATGSGGGSGPQWDAVPKLAGLRAAAVATTSDGAVVFGADPGSGL
jgi:hypothetical protein